MHVLYCTPEITIGKHRWRCRVESSDSYGAVWNYQWFDESLGFWRDMDRWPRYNSNDTYSGCPKGLQKLYYGNEREILEATIRGKEAWLAENQTGPLSWRADSVRQEIQRDRARLDGLRPEQVQTVLFRE